MKEFLTDVESIRARIRREIDRAPVRDGRERERTVFLLNQALALNFVCVLRHMRHFVTADRFDARVVAQEFLEHTVRESEHSDLITACIRKLGGEMTCEWDSMTSRGFFMCDSTSEFEDIIRVDLDAERIAIEAYSDMITWLADVEPTSSRLLAGIRSLEEEHVKIMLDFVAVATK